MSGKKSERARGGMSRNVPLFAAASFFSDVSTEMLYPVLPVYLTQILGVGGGAVGLVEGVATAAQNVVQGVSGTLSDRLQRRKPIALAGYAVSALAKPFIGLAAAWPGVLAARMADRLGAGTRAAPRDALIAGSVAEARRGRAFGLEGAGDNAGAFLGPLLAVLLLTVWHIGLRSIFYLALIPGLLALLMVFFVRECDAEAEPSTRIDVGLSRFSRGYRRYLMATALFNLGNSSNAFLILQTRDLGASLQATILIYAGFNLVAALISYPAGALSDRLGRRNLLVLALVIFTLAYLGFALTRNVVLIAGLFLLYGAFQGVFRSVGKALAGDLSPARLRAGGIGWYGATVGLSGLLASAVAGQLWDRLGHAAVFLFGAGFGAIGVVAVLLLVGNAPAPRPAAEIG